MTPKRLFRLLVYFRRGYALYGVFLSAFNTANVLLLVSTQLFHISLGNSVLYIVVFMVLAIAAMAAVGWWDFRRGQREQEVVVHVVTDPVTMAMVTFSFESALISAKSMRLMAKATGDADFAKLADELEKSVEVRRTKLRKIGVPV